MPTRPGSSHGLRRRPAGRRDEPLPVRRRDRPAPARLRQHQGPPGPVSQPDDAGGLRRRWGQGLDMVTSFADGTKISFEQAIVANATGMSVAKRGMTGPTVDGHIDELTATVTTSTSSSGSGGIVDYVVGAQPAPGRVRPSPRHDDPKQRHYLEPVQARRGPALQLLHALPPVPLRGPDLGRPGACCSATPVAGPAGRPARRRRRDGQDRPERRARCSTASAGT